MNEHAELEQFRLHPPEPYERMKAIAESAVIRWVYATGAYDTLLPFEPERGRYPRGARVDSPAESSIDSLEQFGYDAQGRLVVIREATSDDMGFYETFVRYSQGAIWAWRYDHHPSRRDVATSVLKVVQGPSGPELSIRSTPHGIHKEFYTWRGDRVVRIEEHYSMGLVETYEIEYEKDGHYRLIFVTADGRRFVAFKTDVRDLLELTEAMTRRLVAVLPSLAETHVRSKHTHMFIVYNLESDEELTCPAIALLAHDLESDLKDAIADTVNGDTIDIDDEEFLTLSEELLLTIRVINEYEEVQVAYRQAAAELSRMLAPLKVVPMDTEVSAVEDLAACGLS